jgi:hypothetical protein
MPDGYEVLTGELDAHAGKVDGLGDRLTTAADAANQVAMNDSAYGVVCQPFALLLQPFEDMGVQALRKAVQTIGDIAGTVRDAARAYDSAEGVESSRFRGTEV